jgi:hypothetical protein
VLAQHPGMTVLIASLVLATASRHFGCGTIRK